MAQHDLDRGAPQEQPNFLTRWWGRKTYRWEAILPIVIALGTPVYLATRPHADTGQWIGGVMMIALMVASAVAIWRMGE